MIPQFSLRGRCVFVTVATCALAITASQAEPVGPWDVISCDSASLASGGGSNWGWLNVVNVGISVNDALSGSPILDAGYANADASVRDGPTTEATVIEYAWMTGVINGAGVDVVVFDARFDAADYSLSSDFDGFGASTTVLGTSAISSGEARDYWYELNQSGTFNATIWGYELDLSDIGVPDGATVFAIRASTLNTSGDPVGAGKVGRAFDVTLNGTCPGTITASVTGASPGGTVGFVFARNTGALIIPGGFTCGGTQLGLDATAQLVGTATADASGTASISGFAPQPACNAFVQAVDVATCGTSDVEAVP